MPIMITLEKSYGVKAQFFSFSLSSTSSLRYMEWNSDPIDEATYRLDLVDVSETHHLAAYLPVDHPILS